MRRYIRLTLLIAAVAGVAWIVGRSTAPASRSATASAAIAARQAEADVGLDRIVPEINFRNEPCGDIFDWLHVQTGANISVDWRALMAAGVQRNALLSVRLKGLPLRRVIEVVCAQVGAGIVPIGYHVHDGVIVVSTERDLSGTSVIAIYDVRDLINAEVEAQPPVDPSAPSLQSSGNVCFPPSGHSLGPYESVVTELTEIIQEMVSPESWREAGGSIGTIRVFSGRLIITGSPGMHVQIEKLLAMLRTDGGAARDR